MSDDPNYYDCLERLAPDVEPKVASLIEAAFSPEPNALERALLGEETSAAGTRPDGVQSPPVYISRVTVQGFRGIGPKTALDLQPGPGLSIITGRNGCGKSSFAEAIELALTGKNSRWTHVERSREMEGGWRNLHAGTNARVTVELIGHEVCQLSTHWKDDAETPDDHDFQAKIGSKQFDARPELAWHDAMSVYRPILTYASIGNLHDQSNINLYDQLAKTLGLETLLAAQDRLKNLEDRRKQAKKQSQATWKSLKPELEASTDERAAAVLAAMKPRSQKLDVIEGVCSGAEDDGEEAQLLRAIEALSPPLPARVQGLSQRLAEAHRERTALEGSAAARSQSLSVLLEHALKHEGSHCPVCESTLAEGWRTRATRALVEARRASTAATELDAVLEKTAQLLAGAVPARPYALGRCKALGLDDTAGLLWEELSAAVHQTDPPSIAAEVARLSEPLADAVELLKLEVREKRDAKDADWRPLATKIRAWLPIAKDAFASRQDLKDIDAARTLLRTFEKALVAERFTPIAEQAKGIWALLRQRSHVDLTTIELTGSHRTTRRGVDLGVTVDGHTDVALGVMSQGELHSLALSLFLPRLTHESSPFKFLILDDPVQAMDPAKVDGLAKVLAEVAKTRQVVVFTHDERLPEAVRRLNIEADVLVVERNQGSRVKVRTQRDPVWVYLDDARSLSQGGENLGEKARRHVIPVFCRGAIEAWCRRSYWRGALRDGKTPEEIRVTLDAAQRLMAVMALGLFGDPGRHQDVVPFVKRVAGPRAVDLIKACKKGAHTGWDRLHAERVDTTHHLIAALDRP